MLFERTILSRWGQAPNTQEYERTTATFAAQAWICGRGYAGVDGAATSATIFEQAPAAGPATAVRLLRMEQRAHGILWLRYKSAIR